MARDISCPLIALVDLVVLLLAMDVTVTFGLSGDVLRRGQLCKDATVGTLNAVIRNANCDLPEGSNYLMDFSIYSAEDTLVRICEGTWALNLLSKGAVDACSEESCSSSGIPSFIARSWEPDSNHDFECEQCHSFDHNGWSDRCDHYYCETCWRLYLASPIYSQFAGAMDVTITLGLSGDVLWRGQLCKDATVGTLNTVIRDANFDLPAGSKYVMDFSIYSAEDTLVRICEGTWALILLSSGAVDACSEYIASSWQLLQFPFECEQCHSTDHFGWLDCYDRFYCETCWRPYLAWPIYSPLTGERLKERRPSIANLL